MTRKPFIAHSKLKNEIYIVVGKEKYRVTEQAIKAVMAIKALEQEPTTKNDLPHCQYTDEEIAKSFIEDVEPVMLILSGIKLNILVWMQSMLRMSCRKMILDMVWKE